MGKGTGHGHAHGHGDDHSDEDENTSLLTSHSGKKEKSEKKDGHNHDSHSKTTCCDPKLVAFFAIGVLTMLFVVAELAVALWTHSLVLMSDGFHNLSDVVSLYIAFWAQRAKKRAKTDEMSFGWGRSEILGGLTNGCFLLSLSLYVVLESIPKFIEPEPIESGLLFIIIAGCGLGVNTIGTIVFAITGQGHSHSHGGGGGHSHGHSHGHDHKEKKKEKKKKESLEMSSDNEHAHSHEHKEKKKEKKGHSHSHDEKKKDKKKKKPKKDMNVHAVFLHYLGDAISSMMVLGAGILIHFFPSDKNVWVKYIDPVSSLLIVGLILWTTVPLVKRCAIILLQHTGEVKVGAVRRELQKIEGIISVHDLHVWHLVDGMVIGSVHVACEEGVDFPHVAAEVKKIFHSHGIHSSTIQPEFVPRSHGQRPNCEQNCVKDCDEDWCCKEENKQNHIAPPGKLTQVEVIEQV